MQVQNAKTKSVQPTVLYLLERLDKVLSLPSSLRSHNEHNKLIHQPYESQFRSLCGNLSLQTQHPHQPPNFPR